jgi:hypothetical protein
MSEFFLARVDTKEAANKLQNIFRILASIPCDMTKKANLEPFSSSSSSLPVAAPAAAPKQPKPKEPEPKVKEAKKPVPCLSCDQPKLELKDGVCKSCIKASALYGIPLNCKVCESHEKLGPDGLCASCEIVSKRRTQFAAAAPSSAAAAAAARPSLKSPTPAKVPSSFASKPVKSGGSTAATSKPSKPLKSAGGSASMPPLLEQDDYVPVLRNDEDEDDAESTLSSAIARPAAAAAASSSGSKRVSKADSTKSSSFVPILEKMPDGQQPDPFVLDTEHGVPVNRGQQASVDKIEESIEEVGFAIDSSFKGTGKSVVAAEVGRKYDYIFYVTPVGGVRHDHIATSRRHGNGVAAAISYSTLTGKSNTGVSHGWLIRRDTLKPTTNFKANGAAPAAHYITSYEVTEKLRELIRTKKVLFVLDEVHKARSQSSPRALALATMFSLIFDSNTGTRKPGVESAVLLQSGTLFNRREQVVCILQMVGLLPSIIGVHNKLFVTKRAKKDKGTGNIVEQGTLELGSCKGFYHLCEKLDKPVAKEIYKAYIQYPKKLMSVEPLADKIPMTTSERGSLFLYSLFVRIIQVKYGSSMPIYRHKGFSIKNTFYCFETDAEQEAYNEAVQGFREEQEQQEENRRKNRSVDMMTVWARHKKVDATKVPLLIRAVRTALEADPHCKVFVPVNYTEDLERVVAAFASYTPLVLSGTLKLGENERACLQTMFQEAEYTEDEDGGEPVLQHRLLVANSEMACEGINLQDTSPDSRNHRWAFGMASCHGIRCDQLTARIHRYGIGNDAQINFRWVYGRATRGPPEFIPGTQDPGSEVAEGEILERLAGRSQVLKEVSSLGSTEGTDYAIDYKQEIEIFPGGPMLPVVISNKRKVRDAVDLTSEDHVSGEDEDDEEMKESSQPASSSAAAAAADSSYRRRGSSTAAAAAASDFDEDEEMAHALAMNSDVEEEAESADEIYVGAEEEEAEEEE